MWAWGLGSGAGGLGSGAGGLGRGRGGLGVRLGGPGGGALWPGVGSARKGRIVVPSRAKSRSIKHGLTDRIVTLLQLKIQHDT